MKEFIEWLKSLGIFTDFEIGPTSFSWKYNEIKFTRNQKGGHLTAHATYHNKYGTPYVDDLGQFKRPKSRSLNGLKDYIFDMLRIYSNTNFGRANNYRFDKAEQAENQLMFEQWKNAVLTHNFPQELQIKILSNPVYKKLYRIPDNATGLVTDFDQFGLFEKWGLI